MSTSTRGSRWPETGVAGRAGQRRAAGFRRAFAGLGAAVAALLSLPAAAADADEAELQRLRAEIVAMIGDARCANVVHCRALALGFRPCGGPAEYLAYSSISIASHRQELETKAYEYAFLQEDLQRRQSRTGACTTLREPKLNCVDNRCRLDGAP